MQLMQDLEVYQPLQISQELLVLLVFLVANLVDEVLVFHLLLSLLPLPPLFLLSYLLKSFANLLEYD